MGAEATGLANGKRTPAPALPLVVRTRSRAGRVVDTDDGAGASTPQLRTPVTVPFLWEDAPGRPKQLHGATVQPGEPTGTTKIVAPADGGADAAGVVDGGDHDHDGDGEGEAKARPVPLKLPPRLQVPSSMAERSHSPRTVLQGPYSCARRPFLRRSGSVATSFRRTPSAGGGGFFSRRKAEAATWMSKKGFREERHDADASCSSPSASSSSSSSSSISSFFGDDRGHGARRRPADPEEEEGDGAKGSVRITRFTRNRSLPSMTTSSHLWASIRRSVKQIAPWS